MATSYKNPPALNDEIPYEKWTKEIKLWSIVSKTSKSEQAAAVALSLQGRARKAAMELHLEELNSESGLALLIKKLDGLFLKDSNQRIAPSKGDLACPNKLVGKCTQQRHQTSNLCVQGQGLSTNQIWARGFPM